MQTLVVNEILMQFSTFVENMIAMSEIITSVSNPRIKNLGRIISFSKDRKAQGVFAIEGYREISRAMESGIEVKELYVCPEIDRQGKHKELLNKDNKIQLFEVGTTAFSRIAYREGSDGLIALALPRYISLNDLKLNNKPLILVLESVEKPGNLGAIMRTADAAGVDAVIICDPMTDIYNPNAIRSSLGCIFSIPLAVSSTAKTISYLKSAAITIYSAALKDDAINYLTVDYNTAAAIVMGSEANGLSESWLKASNKSVIIPMLGIADSLNVSTSAAILVFEAIRQRSLS